MKRLKSEQQTLILKAIQEKQIPEVIQEEWLDHICCMVEQKIEQGLTFQRAYAQVFESFELQELADLREGFKSPFRPRRSVIVQFAISALTVAACLLILGLPHPPRIGNDWSGFYSL